MSQHIRFWIRFVRVAFTSTKDTASPYIFKKIFVSIIVSEYDQEIPQSQTADNPVAPRGRAAH